MEIKSLDMKADEAVDAIREMTDRDAIVLFIAGDERKTVIHALPDEVVIKHMRRNGQECP